jgi:hypothetical protein
MATLPFRATMPARILRSHPRSDANVTVVPPSASLGRLLARALRVAFGGVLLIFGLALTSTLVLFPVGVPVALLGLALIMADAEAR